jgi:ammonium transporter, Amt family
MDIGLWVMLGMTALLLRGSVGIYLSGVSRTRNASSTLFRALAETCVAILAFWAIGFGILRHCGAICALRGPWEGSTLFSGAICILAAALAIAPMLERSKLNVSIVGAILVAGLVTPLCWRLAVSHWLAPRGFVDVAGSSFVHFSAGLMGAVGAIAVGPRAGKYNRDGSTNALIGHSATLAASSIFFIFALWIPYVVGCELLRGSAAALPAMFNTALAGAAGGAAAMVYSQLRYRKQDILLVYTGVLGGLVAITGAAGHLIPPWAALTGAVAGVLVPWLEVRLDLFWKIDDPSSFIAICAGAGAWGTLAPAIFSQGPLADRLFRVGVQALGLAVIGAVSVISFGIMMLVLRMTLGIRVREADEQDGLDLCEHDTNAYPDFQQTMIKSYDLRQL